MSKAYIFDAGRVLINYDMDNAHKKFSAACRTHLSTERTEEVLYSPLHRRVYDDYASGKISPKEFYEAICTMLDLDMSFEVFAEAWKSIVTTENTPMHEALRVLDERGARKIILSNTDPLHWSVTKSLGTIAEHFPVEDQCTSHELGCIKPHDEIYPLALTHLGEGYDEIVFFDDMQENLDAAARHGIRGVKYDCRFDPISVVLDEITRE